MIYILRDYSLLLMNLNKWDNRSRYVSAALEDGKSSLEAPLAHRRSLRLSDEAVRFNAFKPGGGFYNLRESCKSVRLMIITALQLLAIKQHGKPEDLIATCEWKASSAASAQRARSTLASIATSARPGTVSRSYSWSSPTGMTGLTMTETITFLGMAITDKQGVLE